MVSMSVRNPPSAVSTTFWTIDPVMKMLVDECTDVASLE